MLHCRTRNGEIFWACCKVTLTKSERDLLLISPDWFGLLVLTGQPRPWPLELVRQAGEAFDVLSGRTQDEVFGFGLLLQRLLEAIPPGVRYPAQPLRELEPEDRAAWLKRLRRKPPA